MRKPREGFYIFDGHITKNLSKSIQNPDERKQDSEKDPNQSGNIPIRSTLKDAEDVSQNAELSTDLPRVDGSRRKICFSITDLARCQLAALRRRSLAWPTHLPPAGTSSVREVEG